MFPCCDWLKVYPNCIFQEVFWSVPVDNTPMKLKRWTERSRGKSHLHTVIACQATLTQECKQHCQLYESAARVASKGTCEQLELCLHIKKGKKETYKLVFDACSDNLIHENWLKVGTANYALAEGLPVGHWCEICKTKDFQNKNTAKSYIVRQHSATDRYMNKW